MVNDQNIKKLISWSDNGESFFVFDIYEFSQVVLPQYFKHNKWSSFVRQLNSNIYAYIYINIIICIYLFINKFI